LVADAGRAARLPPLKTRVELANAIFEYIEVFHNRRRRHSSLGMLKPIEFELNNINTTTQAA
jgi:transposase InsO family protein